MKWAALALTGVVAAGCEPTVPVRGCASCTYDFADTIPPDTSLVFHWPAARLPVRYYADSRAARTALRSRSRQRMEAVMRRLLPFLLVFVALVAG